MTPHIEAKKEEIAKKVIMPGDPMRAKFIAETFLKDYKLVNDVRGMYAYTGYYNNKQVTVMASGMGNPSIGIYSYELFNVYDVDNIIRVGSCGAYTDKLDLYDVILVTESFSDSSYAEVQSDYNGRFISANKELNDKIKEVASKLNIKIHEGIIHNSDVFYDTEDRTYLYKEYGCLGVEMESFALFHNAKQASKKAACILTVSDNLITKKVTTADERQEAFVEMIKLALSSI